ncbi:FtsH protease activity modulator HflK [Desulfogranum japonicum]|uniref:FtsH protease activity modulator HflK n=1 Tax=Desulfogranum japonicum TaxID=231447 RepID=UPI001E55076C|nr:FtsH protease activity modulator HflK [Desulfogranum japonicum]
MNEQPPWGQKKRPSSPEDFLASLIKKIRDSFEQKDDQSPEGNEPSPPQGEGPGFFSGAGKIALLVGAVLLVQGVLTSFYTIQPAELGVLLRFGEYSRTTSPGLHFKIPLIEEVRKVKVEEVQKEEFGFRTKTPGRSTTYSNSNFDNEALMLTGDKNVIEVAWIVQYKVSDPINYLFKVADVKQAVRDASEMVTRRIVGNMDFDYVLGNREILAGDAKRELQSELDNLECGVHIVTLQLQDINPPERVKPAFNEVNEADQDMKRLVNEAEEQYNKVIPKARGSAKQIVEEAKGYAVERVNRSQGETNRFMAIFNEYSGAREVTRQRMYLEAMQEVLPHVKHVYVMDEQQNNVLPLLDVTGRNVSTQPAQ